MKKTRGAVLAAVILCALAGISGATGIDPTMFYSLSNSATSTSLWAIDPNSVDANHQVAKSNVLNLHFADESTPNFMTNTIAFSPSNVLYGWDTGSKRLYTINTINGQIDYIGAPGVNSNLDTQWINGMSFVKTPTGATLYGLSGATNNLYTIDTSTGNANSGKATLLAHIPETLADIMNVGMAVNFRTNELYAVSGCKDGISDILVQVYPGGSPIARVVGNLGIDYNDTGAEFDQNGTLYVLKDSFRLYTLNLGNGTATWVGDLDSGNDADPAQFHSTNLAHPWPDTAPVPEPGTMVLLGSGLAGLAAYGRKRLGR